MDKRVTTGWGVSTGAFFMMSAPIDAKTLPQTAADLLTTS